MSENKRKMIKRGILTGLIIIVIFAVPGFSLEWQVNLSYGSYAKADDYLEEFYEKISGIPGVGASLFFNKKVGFFIDAHFISASGRSTYDNKPLEYSERHISAGLQYRVTIYRVSPVIKLNLFFKGGGLFLRYSETFEEKNNKTIPGFCFGGGILFRLKKTGIGVEAVKNLAYEEVEIQGLDRVEKIDFSGFRFSFKVLYTF
ncbi:MAG: hypothetical protein KAT34_19020 [Candidatus Aminicenantes bacterium]|nr:hypothetical protein [Candidatus Aminicenantes bacterium]